MEFSADFLGVLQSKVLWHRRQFLPVHLWISLWFHIVQALCCCHDRKNCHISRKQVATDLSLGCCLSQFLLSLYEQCFKAVGVKAHRNGWFYWMIWKAGSLKSKTGFSIGPSVIWTASSEFGTYRLCEQRRFRRACASAQSRQNLRCSLIQAVNQEEPSDRKPDPWSLWMAGHAQLKFVMTECSKTQIRLAGLI